MKKVYYTIIVAVAFSACTKNSYPDFQKSVRANQASANILEWEISEENPQNLFKKYRDELKVDPERGKGICAGLQKLTAQELSIFEQEINNQANHLLLKDCREPLKKTLEAYWLEQKKSIQESTLNFRFQTRIEKRDLSKGYRAKTGDVQPKELILTFDDGPDIHYSARILDILGMVDAKVMFFHQGPRVPLGSHILHREAQEGHIIGSHSLSHRCLANTPSCTRGNGGTALTYDEAVAEIRGGHQAIFDVLGFVDPFFRFPYGESDQSLSDFLASKQVAQFHWTIESEDWRARSNQELLAHILRQIDQIQRGIVLFHDTQRRTLEILPEFLKAIYDRGYNLVILHPADEQARYNSQLVTKGSLIP